MGKHLISCSVGKGDAANTGHCLRYNQRVQISVVNRAVTADLTATTNALTGKKHYSY